MEHWEPGLWTKENYKPSKSKEEKANCDSEIRLIYPIDEESGWDEHFKCVNDCSVHIRCEGLAPIEPGYSLPEKYECRKCLNEDSNKTWLKDTLDEESSNICQQIQDLDVKVTSLTMHIEKLEEDDSKCGKRQRQLK